VLLEQQHEQMLLPLDTIDAVVTVKVTRRSRSTLSLPYLSPLSFPHWHHLLPRLTLSPYLCRPDLQ
jgi:hypothetical protein